MTEIRKIIFILVIASFTACESDDTIRYWQFTSDDLSHLYYDEDTLTYIGDKIQYQDLVTFLLNSSDTIVVNVTTEIYSSLNPWRILNVEDMLGHSFLEFDQTTGFKYAHITTFRSSNDGNSEKRFEVGLAGYGYNYFYYQLLEVTEAETFTLDTALVLDKLYEDVYKFNLPQEGNKSGIKLIYFAKKYGYIKIESLDGKMIELISIGKNNS
jgi:hypothetical protein